ncbi:MAG: tetratricopeptide repeat protein [Bacteroidales bacterium]
MKKYIGICIGVVLSVSAIGQNVDIRSYIEKGNLLYDSLDYRSAATQYKHALLLDSTSYDAWFNFASALYNMDKYILASDAFDHAVRMEDDSLSKADALFGKGNSFVKLEDYKQAIAAYKKSLLLNPRDSAAVYNYAYAKIMYDEQQQQQQDNTDDNGNNEENKPSEYALQIKKQADELVAQYKYSEAFELMLEAVKKDETVEQHFDKFIMKLQEISSLVEKHTN